MPYKSKAQAAFMHIHHPEIASKWDDKYESSGDLPKYVKGSKYSKKGVNAVEGLKKAHKSKD